MIRRISLILLLMLALSLPVKGMCGAELIKNAAMKNGTITAISLENNTIIIDQKTFKLSDQVSVTANEDVVSKLLLIPGLQVSYWTKNGLPSGGEEVFKIKVTSKFNKNAYQR